MTLHKEGTATILITLVSTALVYMILRYFLPEQNLIHAAWLVVSAVLLLIVLQFFRKPKRLIERNEKYILAPADGKVVVIEDTVEDEYFKGPRKQISIFMSPVNVHINFNPISGLVKYFRYHPGKYLVAWHPKSSTENERSTIVVEHKNGVEILFRQVAGALARRLVWYVEEGKPVTQGNEFGFIKFGSRIDVYLPLETKVLCQIDDKTVGGKTVIAEF
ncbi:phosphatidylserine decarboxylase family protein [Marinilongibacter aquaticus]|uniref:phosphatidylserine decarboxylase family protein n=1 Tax=Marinilongibacter aquaticus TaxID=2975157 RepID=UPI0021BD2684|nr:phosphatidylserine decarboxylase family protein [Marinilongibacter aquaticus]UBM57358.1 phosphatidylserine decarboxylase family protein [Marinilongibacter aquaticus]